MNKKDALGYYDILGVSMDADARAIKISYRDLAKHWHPDYNKQENAMENFQKLAVAYEVLQNDHSRLVYDLMSEIYDGNNFPQMDSISVIKDKFGEENPFVRVFDLQYVVGKLFKYKQREERVICSQIQAKGEIMRCSLLNWVLGWWGLKAFVVNLKAIIGNYKAINHNNSENLKLLLHNAIVFAKEEKKEKAYLSAVQALDYADVKQQKKIREFIDKLEVRSSARIPSWNYTRLRLVQLVIPFGISIMLAYPLVDSFSFFKFASKENEITYFQKVRFSSGDETHDDVVVSKIFDIPVNINDVSMLYYLTQDCNIMYGPGKQFDIMQKGQNRQTVRVTGFTPDKTWFRVMIDNGEMGFVKSDELRKGTGKKIPDYSKIFSVNN